MPVWGFGGCPNEEDVVSHFFPVNGNIEDPEVEGV